ncbi:hypothetical protein [Flavobacterium sp. Leaf82]|uniref:hypothetical protein n=1 Tax=Flavobacterium sp. Leaf82 TaxID=1736238 RepID=UPI00103FF8C0|nr:hypothetical protein [Flavobacterium sp. Leaf82]
MKSFLLMSMTAFLVFSCSADQDYNSEIVNTVVPNANEKGINAFNKFNPFEQTGINFYNDLDFYVSKYGYPSSNEHLIDQVFFLLAKRGDSKMTGKSVITITPELISLILSDPEGKLVEIINDSDLSIAVKTNLNEFVADLISRAQDDYDEVYEHIVSYEAAVVVDSILEEDEKDTILKVSSISRYSLYAEARQRDPDWKTSVTNRPSVPFLKENQMTYINLTVLLNAIK